MPKILIGTPNFTASFHCLAAGKFMECYAAWKQVYGYDNVKWRITPRMFVHFARNRITQECMDEGFDYMFWLDDDAIPDVELLPKMLKHFENPEVNIVIAPYFMRRPPYAVGILNAGPDGLDYINGYQNISHTDLNQGLIECDGGGTHCMLIKREVMEKVPKPWFRLPPLGGTEDMYFCLKVRKLGMKIHADTDLVVPHIGDNHIITEQYRRAWVSKHGNKTVEAVITDPEVQKGYISIDADFADGFEQHDGFTSIQASVAHKEGSKEQEK